MKYKLPQLLVSVSQNLLYLLLVSLMLSMKKKIEGLASQVYLPHKYSTRFLTPFHTLFKMVLCWYFSPFLLNFCFFFFSHFQRLHSCFRFLPLNNKQGKRCLANLYPSPFSNSSLLPFTHKILKRLTWNCSSSLFYVITSQFNFGKIFQYFSLDFFYCISSSL